MLDVHELLASLAAKRPVFHSEADFQHALAWEIHLAFPDAVVRLERPYRTGEGPRIHLDLWVKGSDRTAVLELKYKTKKMRVEIRHATEADMESIMALLAVLYKGDIGHGLRTLVDEYLNSSAHTVLLAQNQSNVLGLLIGSKRLDIDWECRAALVDAVVVSDSARGQGIGKGLVREFCAWARDQDCLVLQAINPNEGDCSTITE